MEILLHQPTDQHQHQQLHQSDGQTRLLLLPDGQIDAVGILRHLADLAFSFSQNDLVRDTSIRVIATTVDNNEWESINLITRFVRERIVYVADPCDVEYVTSPVVLLEKIAEDGVAYGDCDDHVLLHCAMLGSIGVRCRPVAVKLNPGSPVFDHVITEILYRGSWRDIDPCAKFSNAVNYNEKLIP